MGKVFCILVSMFIFCSGLHVHAAFSLKNGWFVDADEIATLSVQEHYNLGLKAIEDCHWKEAIKQLKIVITSYPSTPYAQEASYYLGVAYFYSEEYDFANDVFTEYLKTVNNPRFFQETVQYKYAIADRFKNGAKRRFFGTKKLPKWASGQSLALKIYDEVIAAVPSHEIAAKALVSKGYLLWNLKEYRDAVSSFQMVIKRFPKHELAPECFLLITKVYLDQSQYEFQNPDILAFAQINLRKFKHDFPREERLGQAEADVMAIKEIYARGLYDTGQFYERISYPRAAIIYYQNAINQFPDTVIANLCRQRLKMFGIEPTAEELQGPLSEEMCHMPAEQVLNDIQEQNVPHSS